MSRSREILLAFAVAFAAAAALTWPVVARPDSVVVGRSYNDHASIVWTLHWVASRLAAGQAPWGWTDLLQYPEGVQLFPTDPLESVLLAPITLLVGPVVAHNLLNLLHLTLAGGLTYGWLRRVGADVPGALTGGIAYFAAPALLTTTFNGNPDVTAFYWVPAALWVLATPGRGLLAGLMGGLAGCCSPYAGLMTVVAVGTVLLVERRWRELITAALLSGAIGLGLSALTLDVLSDPRAGVAKLLSGGLPGAATLLSLVRPTPGIAIADPEWPQASVAQTAYLGISLLGAALLARGGRRLGLAVAASGLLLALGPELRIHDLGLESGLKAYADGAATLPGRTGIPLPWALVQKLPALGQLHLLGRMTALVVLGLAWWAATGMAWMGRARWLVPLVVALDLLWAAEGASLLRPSPFWRDGTCEALRDLPEGAVVDLPPTSQELWMGLQTCHGRPISSGINRSLTNTLGVAMHGRNPQRFLRAANADGFRWLIWHNRLPSRHGVEAIEGMTPCRVVRTSQVEIYELRCMMELSRPATDPRGADPNRRH